MLKRHDNNNISISTLLILLTEISHFLLVMCREYKGQLLATQKYKDWKDAKKSTYASVSLHKNYSKF